MQELISRLCRIIPRRGKKEIEALQVLINELTDLKIAFKLQKFTATIPITQKAILFADDKQIPCLGASFTSGTFSKQSPVMNSFQSEADTSTIIFNPVHHGICMAVIKTQPAISINRDSIVELVMAREIKGEVLVTQEEFESANILVGNLTAPKNIFFAHYDSVVGAGAIDNAGSVAVMMEIIKENPQAIQNNLFIFAGCEEESVSSHNGGYGFQVFDKEYGDLMDNAAKIIVLDGVGVTKPALTQDNLEWVLPISRLDQIQDKVYWMYNDQTAVMKYYHSILDTPDKLNEKSLLEAYAEILAILG